MSKSSIAIAAESGLPTGMRSTRATRALIAWLRSNAQQRYSAAEVEAALARLGVAVNRVTVFRALDRLTQAGMLQKRVESDRVNRYQWQSGSANRQNANPNLVQEPLPATGIVWEYTQCHVQRAVALGSSVQLALQVLAQSAQAASVQQVAMHGICAACAATD